MKLSHPDIGWYERLLIDRVLSSGTLSQGPMLELFEAAFSEYHDVPYAIGVTSGTAGLHLAIIACDLQVGDEVITTPLSFIASANCICYERAKPIFVDVDAETWTLDPILVAPALTSRTRAILPVHLFGIRADIAGLSAFGYPVIEDACEAVGIIPGKVAIYAFYPNKQMTTAEGGMIVTREPAFADRIGRLRNHGRDDQGRFVELGYNYRLDELRAALGLGQLQRLPELLSNRAQVAQWYTDRIEDVVALMPKPETWFAYVIRVKDRDLVAVDLAKLDIPTRPYFPAIHLQPFYQSEFGYKEGDFPIAEEIARETLALPFHGQMTEEEVETVCIALVDVLS